MPAHIHSLDTELGTPVQYNEMFRIFWPPVYIYRVDKNIFYILKFTTTILYNLNKKHKVELSYFSDNVLLQKLNINKHLKYRICFTVVTGVTNKVVKSSIFSVQCVKNCFFSFIFYNRLAGADPVIEFNVSKCLNLLFWDCERKP